MSYSGGCVALFSQFRVGCCLVPCGLCLDGTVTSYWLISFF